MKIDSKRKEEKSRSEDEELAELVQKSLKKLLPSFVEKLSEKTI